jgi:hypothetical protein
MVRPFDHRFTPPAAVAEVIVTHPVSSANSGVLSGKLDTGADLTVIPETLESETPALDAFVAEATL